MKQVMQFRVFPETRALIEQTATAMHLNKTEVVERAVAEFAKHNVPNHILLKHAGILQKKEGDEMLELIRNSRKNKTHLAIL